MDGSATPKRNTNNHRYLLYSRVYYRYIGHLLNFRYHTYCLSHRWSCRSSYNGSLLERRERGWPTRTDSHSILPPAKLQELARLNLYYNLPEVAIICTKCGFALSPERIGASGWEVRHCQICSAWPQTSSYPRCTSQIQTPWPWDLMDHNLTRILRYKKAFIVSTAVSGYNTSLCVLYFYCVSSVKFTNTDPG